MNTHYIVKAYYLLKSFFTEDPFPTITYARTHAKKLRKKGYRVTIYKRETIDTIVK